MIEYYLIKEIAANSHHTQRSLAKKLGVSLGKINYLIAGLVEKGTVRAKRFRRTPGSIRWQYLLTPEGIREKMVLTKKYLVRRKEEYVALQNEIASLEEEMCTIGTDRAKKIVSGEGSL